MLYCGALRTSVDLWRKEKEDYDDAGVVEQALEEWELGVWGNHEFVDTSENFVEGYCVGVGLWYFPIKIPSMLSTRTPLISMYVASLSILQKATCLLFSLSH
jgi:hypothetical protein